MLSKLVDLQDQEIIEEIFQKSNQHKHISFQQFLKILKE